MVGITTKLGKDNGEGIIFSIGIVALLDSEEPNIEEKVGKDFEGLLKESSQIIVSNSDRNYSYYFVYDGDMPPATIYESKITID